MSIDELKAKLSKESEKKEMILKEFKRKSFEILRAFRSLIGFKVKYSERVVKLACERTPNNYLSFRVTEHSEGLKRLRICIKLINFS